MCTSEDLRLFICYAACTLINVSETYISTAFTLINVSETCYGNIYLQVRNVEQGNVKHEKGIKWNIFDDFFQDSCSIVQHVQL